MKYSQFTTEIISSILIKCNISPDDFWRSQLSSIVDLELNYDFSIGQFLFPVGFFIDYDFSIAQSLFPLEFWAHYGFLEARSLSPLELQLQTPWIKDSIPTIINNCPPQTQKNQSRINLFFDQISTSLEKNTHTRVIRGNNNGHSLQDAHDLAHVLDKTVVDLYTDKGEIKCTKPLYKTTSHSVSLTATIDIKNISSNPQSNECPISFGISFKSF